MSLRLIKTLTFLFAFALLGGCGQKGDLYLPGENQAALVSDVYVG
ncbi:MAG: lipoprotein [Candidatus Poribacteria bacterium]